MKKFCKSCGHRCQRDNILKEKLHCNYCCSDYCSTQCFIKGEKKSYYYSAYEPPCENINLYFSCCDTRICGSCLSDEIENNSMILLCDKCNCYFHSDNSCVNPLGFVDTDYCTCKLCIDLTNGIRYDSCQKCHKDNNQEMFFYDHITTISEFGDILDAYRFIGCKMWHDPNPVIYNPKDGTSFIQPRIEPKYIECKKMDFFRNLYEPTRSEDQEHFIKTRSINCNCEICKKFTHWNDMIIGALLDENDLIKTILIECDCELCTKINCKTTLLANMIGNEYIIDSTNCWDCGDDFAPILALNMLAKNESNNCKCSVCKFYSEYK